jgi:protein-L-isoaspartate(D-aspartate) O-methyltransferase
VTAVLHHLAPSATVVGIDHLPGLVDLAKANLAKDGIQLNNEAGGVQIVLGDGRKGMSVHL